MLYLVATPIGNLKDISLRALEVLREVDFIASEDTRKTGMMLKHYEVNSRQIAYQEYNEARVLPKLVSILEEGKSLALVTDAGTPAISDPGFTLVRAALERGIPVTAIPGPTALIMAVTVSGLPVHSFTYRGFPPRKSGQRQRFFAVDAASPHTLIFYESPHRLLGFLEDALAVYGDRPACIANDLTKMFETYWRGSISELIEQVRQSEPRGEYTIVIGGLDEKTARSSDDEDQPTRVKRNKYPTARDQAIRE